MASIEREILETWSRDPAVRAEFGTLTRFAAFRKAEAAGSVSCGRGPVKRLPRSCDHRLSEGQRAMAILKEWAEDLSLRVGFQTLGLYADWVGQHVARTAKAI